MQQAWTFTSGLHTRYSGNWGSLPVFYNSRLYTVVNCMRRNSLILLSTALLLGAGYASAAESQHSSADSNPSCPDTAATSNDRNELGEIDPATTTVAPVRRAEKAKILVTPRNGGTRATAPRWHSFLPGMFR